MSMNFYRTAIALFVFISMFFVACKDNGTELESISNKENDIREVVFRYQFGNNESGQQQSTKIYFISVMSKPDSSASWIYGDPDPELLRRFDGNVPLVKPYSLCTLSVFGVFDRESGQRGLLFRTSEIRWISDDEVEVDGGYFEGGLSASGNTYYLKRENGRWVVTRDVLHWIA
jgi:hypothetical protein